MCLLRIEIFLLVHKRRTLSNKPMISRLILFILLYLVFLGMPSFAIDEPSVFNADMSTYAYYMNDGSIPPVLKIEELGSQNIDLNMSKIKEYEDIFTASIEIGNAEVSKMALIIASRTPGDHTIDQVNGLYNYLVNGDIQLQRQKWIYVGDPYGKEYFRYANESLKLGNDTGCSGVGDCDDFAILMSSFVQAIGGTSRIILAGNNSSTHAYSEVYLGRIGAKDGYVEKTIQWLAEYYDANDIYVHINNRTKEVWLNLDWQPDSEHLARPGGPFWEADWSIILLDRFDKNPLNVRDEERTFGRSYLDEARSLVRTRDGGYIIAGNTLSYGQYYSNKYRQRYSDLWLLKINPKGFKTWNKYFGGPGADSGNFIQETLDGCFLTTGNANASEDNDQDLWLIKTDPDGNKIWAKSFGGSNLDEGQSLLVSKIGGAIIAGITESYGAGDSDIWLVKTDSNGNEVWNKTFGGSRADKCNWIEAAKESGYIIAGSTRSYSVAGDWDAWIIRTDLNGNKVWDKTFGGLGADVAKSLHRTNDGGYIITGKKFLNEKSNLWLFKINADGQLLWERAFDNDFIMDSEGISVLPTQDDGYIILGNKIEDNDKDIWLIKTNESGNTVWEKTFGGPYPDEGNAIQQADNNGFIIVGTTFSYGIGGGDAWLMEIDRQGNKLW